MSEFFNSCYENLTPYVPGEQPQDRTYIKLNTNESPYPPAYSLKSDFDMELIKGLKLYSDPDVKELKEVIAEFYDLDKKEVFIGNGSDECLYYSFMAFGGDGVSFPDITYGFYKVYADVNHLRANVIPLKEDFSIDAGDYKNLGTAIIIANPNAPTGLMLSLIEIREILENNKNNVVIIDEAYIDFADEKSSAVSLISEYDNLLVIQTFSKSRSLAGARVGFAMGGAGLIADLDRIKFSINPYNVNTLSMKMAVEGIKNTGYFYENCNKIKETREFTKNELEKLGFKVLDSRANFLFAGNDKISGMRLYEELKFRGILIRHFNDERIKEYNRITIGSMEEMKIFIEKVKEIIKN